MYQFSIFLQSEIHQMKRSTMKTRSQIEQQQHITESKILYTHILIWNLPWLKFINFYICEECRVRIYVKNYGITKKKDKQIKRERKCVCFLLFKNVKYVYVYITAKIYGYF